MLGVASVPHLLSVGRNRGGIYREKVIPEDDVLSVVMATGTVDFFNDTGGYGFIDSEDADEDVFFHMEDVGGPDLEEGQEVEFDIEQADKGPRATNLTRL
jgi:CspA family cold shock protein